MTAPMTGSTNATFAGFFDGRGHVVRVRTEKDAESFAVPYFYNVTGVIVNTASSVAHKGVTNRLAYTAS